jgi:hypothetical protein
MDRASLARGSVHEEEPMIARRLVLLLLLCGLGLATCRKKERQVDRRKIAALGRRAADQLAATLRQRLVKAIQQGPDRALAVCSHEAQGLTRDVQQKLRQGLRLKRTSQRIRNPRNAPDPDERRALAWFAVQLRETGRMPTHHIQVTKTRRGTVYRYYQPLQVRRLCLTCHGPRDELSAPVRRALGKRYPRDAAVGYKPGELRGLISVTIPSRLVR